MDSPGASGGDEPVFDKAYSRIKYHEESGTYRSEFDGHTRPASVAVVMAVAEAAGVDPLDLEPIHSVVDPDALDDVCQASTRKDSFHDASVTFEYCDHAITVNRQGTVIVEPTQRSTA